MKLFVLAIGVHPDDVELSASGTLINEVRKGNAAGVLDLTEGELGTRGTVETRYAEAAKAAEVMGLSVRENLCMRDGFFKNDEEHQMKVIQAIRKYQPEVILANILDDRHPDHGRAGRLVVDAAFLAGLSKIETFDENGQPQKRWRPKHVLHYIQDRFMSQIWWLTSPMFLNNAWKPSWPMVRNFIQLLIRAKEAKPIFQLLISWRH